MPVQNSYTAYHKAAVAGQRVDLSLVNIESYTAEEAIPMGYAVVQGSVGGSCKLPDAITDFFLGVAEYTSAGTYDADGAHEYQDEREVNVLDFGKVWVMAIKTVAIGDPVHVRVLNPAAGEVVGGFENAADGVETFLVPGAYWATAATAGDLAQIKVTRLMNLA